MNRVDDRIAIVTGAAGGIGSATCRLLVGHGAKVIATDLSEAPPESLTTLLTTCAESIVYRSLDVRNEADWQATFDDAQQRFGRVDILVNNAGIYFHGRVEDTDPKDMERVFDINLKGVVLGTKYAFRSMKTRDAALPLASIVNLSSIAGLKGSPMSTLYGLSKGGVRIYTKACATEAAELRYRIRVNSVHPGIVATDMADGVASSIRSRGIADGQIRDVMARVHPLGRLADPEEIARGIVFLASDDSSFMTGSELVIDGGATAR